MRLATTSSAKWADGALYKRNALYIVPIHDDFFSNHIKQLLFNCNIKNALNCRDNITA